MRILPVLLLIALSSCAQNPPRPTTRAEEDTSIQFPNSYGRTSTQVGQEGNVYVIDGVTLRAINVAANDFIPPESKGSPCWEKREAHRFQIIRQGDILFIDVSLDPFYCQMPFMFFDYGVKYAISTDGRILRRLYAGEPEGPPYSPPLTDAGEPDPAYIVDPSKLGTTDAPNDPRMVEMMERLGGRKSSPQDGGSSPPPPNAGTPVAPSQADGGTPPSP